jgi:hypothetical protein
MRASFISYFSEIATEEESNFKKYLAEWQQAKSDNPDFITNEEQELAICLEKCCIKIIVFLTNYLKAYIWDKAAQYLGEKDAEKLDKLATADKWEIIPRLIVGRKDMMKPHDLGLLKELIRERNKLIHHKSIDISPYIGVGTPADKYPKDLINIWERVKIADFSKTAKHLVETLEAELYKAKKL